MTLSFVIPDSCCRNWLLSIPSVSSSPSFGSTKCSGEGHRDRPMLCSLINRDCNKIACILQVIWTFSHIDQECMNMHSCIYIMEGPYRVLHSWFQPTAHMQFCQNLNECSQLRKKPHGSIEKYINKFWQQSL